MLISELIERLFEIMAEYGDLDVIDPVYENVDGEWVPLWGTKGLGLDVINHPEHPEQLALEIQV